MSKRDIGQEILEAIRDIKAYKAGEKTLHTHTLKEPAPPQVHSCKAKVIAGGICGPDGCEFANSSGLGTGTP